MILLLIQTPASTQDARRLTQTQSEFINSLIERAARKRGIIRADATSNDAHTNADIRLAESPDTSTKEAELKSKKTDGSGPTDTPPGSRINKKGSHTTNNSSKNSWVTLRLLAATGILGVGSFITHFTNIISDENPIKDWASLAFDGGSAFTGALTIASVLAPIDADNSSIHNI